MVHVATDDLGACHRSKQERHHHIRDGIKQWAVWLATTHCNGRGMVLCLAVRCIRERPEAWLPCLKKHSWRFGSPGTPLRTFELGCRNVVVDFAECCFVQDTCKNLICRNVR